MNKKFQQFIADDEGLELVEYAAIIVAAVAAVTAIAALMGKVAGAFDKAGGWFG